MVKKMRNKERGEARRGDLQDPIIGTHLRLGKWVSRVHLGRCSTKVIEKTITAWAWSEPSPLGVDLDRPYIRVACEVRPKGVSHPGHSCLLDIAFWPHPMTTRKFMLELGSTLWVKLKGNEQPSP